MIRVRGGVVFALFTAAWIGYDAAAPDGEMLTDAARRVHARHPWLWTGAVLASAAHLLDVYRRSGFGWADPYTRAADVAACLFSRIRCYCKEFR